MEQCVYEQTEEIYCCQCLETADSNRQYRLVMKALRKRGKLVGNVWMCPKCADQIAALDAEFSPIYKTTIKPVVAG
jgi:uncharacterized protein with PIN domain